jgi:hypothetical protein|tara:strand:+ start:6156 stop:6383 length:228 start_codon:yes stop_codon:yes gene_type:complete
MPYYTVTDTKTKQSEEVLCSWDELQLLLEDNPNLIKEMSAPNIVGGVGGIKNDNGWKDMLKTIKKGSGSGNTIDI